VLLLLLAASNLNANNIQVSNTKLTGQNTTDGYTLVQFDLSREKSRLSYTASKTGLKLLSQPNIPGYDSGCFFCYNQQNARKVQQNARKVLSFCRIPTVLLPQFFAMAIQLSDL